MEHYILPLFCLLLNFVASCACVRFLVSREGLYWILPLVVSALMFLQNGSIMYANGALVQPPLSAGSAIDALLSIFWYLVIITFHFALKQKIRESNYRERVRKDLAESRYLLKSEAKIMAAAAKRRRRNATGGAVGGERGLYPLSWCDSFDQA